jgi:hypothetical protein
MGQCHTSALKGIHSGQKGGIVLIFDSAIENSQRNERFQFLSDDGLFCIGPENGSGESSNAGYSISVGPGGMGRDIGARQPRWAECQRRKRAGKHMGGARATPRCACSRHQKEYFNPNCRLRAPNEELTTPVRGVATLPFGLIQPAFLRLSAAGSAFP